MNSKDLPVVEIENKVTYFIFQEFTTVVANGLKNFLDLVDKAWSRALASL